MVSKNRDARFVCVISMSAPNETTQTFKGTVSGVITTERQGEHGFGYDPIFYVPEKVKLWLNLLQQKRVKSVIEVMQLRN